MHSLFYSTVITYPFLVTVIYWGVLYKGPWFPEQFNAWSNISQHAMNTLFALFELFFTRTNPPIWIHLFFLIIILACYLGLAYLTHYTQGFYVYPFLDPSNGHSKTVVAYVFGIAAAIIVIYLLTKGLIVLRKLVTEKKMGMVGKFHGGRAMNQGDAELESTRMWEK
jgi:hypothetical protein